MVEYQKQENVLIDIINFTKLIIDNKYKLLISVIVGFALGIFISNQRFDTSVNYGVNISEKHPSTLSALSFYVAEIFETQKLEFKTDSVFPKAIIDSKKKFKKYHIK